MQLAKSQISLRRPAEGWITYHFAHCCLIAGEFSAGLKSLESLLYSGEADDIDKSLAFARLNAELLASTGEVRSGFERLQAALQLKDAGKAKPVTISQAKSTLAWLLTLLGQYSEALALADEGYKDAQIRKDNTGMAVALTRKGVILYLTTAPSEAAQVLHRAVELFSQTGDQRGLSWSLSYLGASQLAQGLVATAQPPLERAIQIQAEHSACSIDYYTVLKQIRTKLSPGKLLRRIDAEIRRLHAKIGDYHPDL